MATNAAQKAKGGNKWTYGASEGAKAGSAFGPWGTVFGALGGAVDQGIGGGKAGKPLGFTPYGELGGEGSLYESFQPPEGYNWREVFGKKPSTVPYKKVPAPDVFANWQQNLADAQALLGQTGDLVQGSNAIANQTSTNRVNWIDQLLPGYTDALAQSSGNTNALLKGQLSNSDAKALTREGNDMRSLVGTPGNFGNATARDLGLKQFELQEMGQKNLSDITQIAEMLSPYAAQANVKDFQITPLQRIAAEQFNANFESGERQYRHGVQQNKQSIKAAPDPVASNLFSALTTLNLAQMGISAGNAGNNNMAGWAALGSGLGSIFSGSGQGNKATPTVTANASSTSNPWANNPTAGQSVGFSGNTSGKSLSDRPYGY